MELANRNPEPSESADERRIHARVYVRAEIEVSGEQGHTQAVLQDVSLGGARFVTPTPVGTIGETILIFLPYNSKAEIGAMAEIVRTQFRDGVYTTAVRFSLVEPGLQSKLNKLIDLLIAGESGSGRRHARIARRMRLRYGNRGQMTAMLGDISQGGLSMNVGSPMEVGDEVLVVVPDSLGSDCLRLRARVVNQQMIRKEEVMMFRVGLAFAPMDSVTRSTLSILLRHYAKTSSPQ